MEKLGRQGRATSVEALSQVVADPDADVRKAAAEALGCTGIPEALPALVSLLRDAEAEVRCAVVKGLAQLRCEGVTAALVGALGDPHGEVAWNAAVALKKRDWQAASETEEAAWHLAKGHYDNALALGSAAVEPLGKITRSTAFHRSIKAIEYLARINDPLAIKPLIEALRSEDSSVRSAAAEALGQAGDARAIDPLLRALEDPHRLVCLAACSSLSRIGDRRVVEPLIKLLSHEAADVRSTAAEALGKLRDLQAVHPLLPLLEDSDTMVRENTAVALGQLRDDTAVECLVLALTDAEVNVRQAAARGLRMIEPYWERSDLALRAIPRLQAALKHKEYWVRHSAAEVLNKLGREQNRDPALFTDTDGARQKRHAAMGILLSLLEDTDRDFRHAAADGLGRLGLPEPIRPLTYRLSDSDRGVSAAAARALEALRWQPDGPTERARHLLALERWADAVALGNGAVEAIVETFAWNDADSRRRAIESLVQIGCPAAINALRALAENGEEPVRGEALVALAVLGVTNDSTMSASATV